MTEAPKGGGGGEVVGGGAAGSRPEGRPFASASFTSGKQRGLGSKSSPPAFFEVSRRLLTQLHVQIVNLQFFNPTIISCEVTPTSRHRSCTCPPPPLFRTPTHPHTHMHFRVLPLHRPPTLHPFPSKPQSRCWLGSTSARGAVQRGSRNCVRGCGGRWVGAGGKAGLQDGGWVLEKGARCTH